MFNIAGTTIKSYMQRRIFNNPGFHHTLRSVQTNPIDAFNIEPIQCAPHLQLRNLYCLQRMQ